MQPCTCAAVPRTRAATQMVGFEDSFQAGQLVGRRAAHRHPLLCLGVIAVQVGMVQTGQAFVGLLELHGFYCAVVPGVCQPFCTDI